VSLVVFLEPLLACFLLFDNDKTKKGKEVRPNEDEKSGVIPSGCRRLGKLRGEQRIGSRN
jgi:hypothetical protein